MTKEQLLEKIQELLNRNVTLENKMQQLNKTPVQLDMNNGDMDKTFFSLPHLHYIIDSRDQTFSFVRSDASQNGADERPPCFKLIHIEDRPCEEVGNGCISIEIEKTNKLVVAEHVQISEEGRKYFEVYGAPALAQDGIITHIIEYPLNITVRKDAATLHLRKYENIFNAASDGIVVIDSQGYIKEVNRQMSKMFGYLRSEFLDLYGKDLIAPEYHHLLKEISDDIHVKGEFYTGIIGIRKDGSSFNLELKGSTYIEEDGPQMLVIMRDVTERKRAEEYAVLSQMRYRTIFDASTDGMLVVGSSDIIRDANKTICEMFGYTYEEILQIKAKELAPSSAYESFKKLRSDVQDKGLFHLETKGLRKDGTTFDMEVFGKVFIFQDQYQLLGLMRDITERKNIERELFRRQEELVARTKSIEETNVALKVLLNRREQDRQEFEEMLMLNVKELVLPYIDMLKSSNPKVPQKKTIATLEYNLLNIVSPFLQNLKLEFHGLTHSEMKIATLIKEGKQSKEIADIMGLSKRTVDSYRYNIRKKLDISDSTNLYSFLSSIKHST